ncbi:MAG: hypothetical protein H8E44_07740 [Planctomycetes bacterium]|nr:hypothetical protein [Planctomycetota bacterium]
MEAQEYEQSLNQIHSLAKSRDLQSLERFAEEIEAKWIRKKPELYARLMLHLVDNLSSVVAEYSKYRAITEKYAIELLDKVDAMPLDVEFGLLRYVRHEFEDQTVKLPDDKTLNQVRRQKAGRWLDAWKRLHQGIDKNWDPEDLPRKNIAPPDATGLPSGVAPDTIEDPKLRAEYEMAIETNRQKNEEYKKQYRLRKLKKRFSRKIEKFLVTAYSTPPYNMQELGKYLRDYVDDEELRARILEAVASNVAQEQVK